MSFDGFESSIAGGKPVRLYEFARGNQRWFYTDAALDVMFQGNRYRSGTAISDDGIRQTGEASAEALTVTVPLSFELLGLYRSHSPSRPIELIIRDMHHGDNEALVQWMGRITDVSRRAKQARIVCRADSSEQADTSLRLVWSRECPYSLYDHLCRVDAADHAVAAVILTSTNLVITAEELAAQPNAWFAGGYIEWDADGNTVEQRGIDTHTGNTLVLLGGSFDLVPGMPFRAYPGCARVIGVCYSKFNNSSNYGGAPGMPGKSPFDGDPVF